MIDAGRLSLLSGVLLVCSGLLFWYSYLRGRRALRIARRLNIDVRALPGAGTFSEQSISEAADHVLQAAGLKKLQRAYIPLLLRAGAYFPGAPIWFLAAKVLGLAAIMPLLALLPPLPESTAGYCVRIMGGGAVIWILPDLVLRALARDRKARLLRGLPEWLDLHTTLVEGGMGFDAALLRITTESQTSTEPIYQELSLVQKEISMGADRLVSLRRMAQRTQVEELDQVVAALVQADRLGAGIVLALRAQSDMLRNKIWEDARTRAEKLPTKLLFPIFMGFVPIFFALIIFPLSMRIVMGLRGGR